MRQYSFLQAIPLSFFSTKLYRDVARNWGSDAFLYLFFLAALVSIGVTYRAQVALNGMYAQVSTTVVPQVPVLTLVNGKLSTPEKRRYEILTPGTKDVMMVIDTSGPYTGAEKLKESILITENAVVTKQHDEVRIRKLPDVSATIEPMVIDQVIKRYIGFAWIMMYAFILFFSYITRLVSAVFYALLGRIAAALVHVNLTYGQVVRLAMVAVTPALILDEVMLFSTYVLPHYQAIYFGVTALYLVFAVLANKKSSI